MYFRFSLVLLCSVSVSIAHHAQVHALENDDVAWFDFTGWRHDWVLGEGQTFHDVYGTIDVTITATGEFPFGTDFNGVHIATGQEIPGTQVFTFGFSDVSSGTQLVVEIPTLDSQEELTLAAPGVESYMHEEGGIPVISPATPDMTLTGIDTRFPPVSMPGATHGYVVTDIQSGPDFTLTVSYESLQNNKFEFLRVGNLIPEPNSISMAICGLLGICTVVRRRLR